MITKQTWKWMFLKLRKPIFLLLCGVFCSCGASGAYGSTNIFGRLWPHPVQIEPTKNQFILDNNVEIAATEREASVAHKLQKLLQTGAGISLAICQAADKSSTNRQIRLKIGKLPDIPQNTEGYVLRVEVDGATIVSQSEAGLLYGAQTFVQLASAHDGRAALQCCIINDWPALPFRGTMMNLRYVDATNPEEIKSLYRLLDAFAALKLNIVLLEFEDNFKYNRRSFPASSARAFTKAQVEELVKYARERNIEVVPYLQVPSHATWILSNPQNKELLEDPLATGWNTNMCLSNPKTLAFLKDIINETIEAIHPRQFLIAMDEINMSPYRQCEQCRVQEPSRLLLKFVNGVHDILASQNVKMMMFHDTFLPPPTLGKPHPYYREDKAEGWKVVDQLPKDIIICDWDYDIFNNAAKERYSYFAKRGFKMFGLNFVKPEGIRTFAKGLADEAALGMIASHWYYGGKWSEYDKISPESWAAIALTAQYGWNPGGPELTELSDDDLVYRLASEMPPKMPPKRRLISGNISYPVSLDRYINRRVTATSGLWPEWEAKASVGAILDFPMIQCGDVQFKLNKTVKGIGAVVLAGYPGDGLADSPITITVNRKADSVAFLHVCNIPINYDRYNGSAGASQKPAIGTYVIKYDDGSVFEENIKYRWNITDWNSAYGVFDGRIAAIGKTADGSRAMIISHEWKNPFPDKMIQEIVFSTKMKDGMSPALLAVSLLGGKISEKEAISEVPLNKSSNNLPQQNTAIKLAIPTVAEKEVLLDGFEYESSHDLSQHIQIDEANLTSPVTWKINKDIYFHGKSSLELIIPEGETKTPRTQRIIVDVDLPADWPVSKAQQLTFWVRCADPSSFGKEGLRFGIYLMETVGNAAGYRVAYKDVEANSEWRQVVVDVDSMIEEKKAKSGKFKILRLSFWLDPNRIAPNKVYLDDLGWRSEKGRYHFDMRKVWYEWNW